MLGKQKIVRLMYSLISLFIVMAVYPIKINGAMDESILSGVYHCIIWAIILYFIWRTSLISLFHYSVKNTFYKKNNLESDSRDHYQWIYVVRGFAIIAVVVCHQQFFLHDTEWL